MPSVGLPSVGLSLDDSSSTDVPQIRTSLTPFSTAVADFHHHAAKLWIGLRKHHSALPRVSDLGEGEGGEISGLMWKIFFLWSAWKLRSIFYNSYMASKFDFAIT